MYHDSVRWTFGPHLDRFRDVRNPNFVQVSRVNGHICFFSASESDSNQVYVFMTDYEADQLIQYLQKLLNEK
ncbi:MAG: hypothetical protein EAZ20_00195 [Bacteroidetes bacterium]|nr:MAG: hypothetical protein EAZ20_00195 [Bacteroidota bacterium]